ncbi:hypothetical protein [Lysinibacillus odysseyi]|uniref:hypothetical protein n=1 Tax=Lysinibacillus odysseyi TaxID=202611 RepID=UPI000ABD56BD|nr:hypothetical protein [Lysinibacillus odysseyi]
MNEKIINEGLLYVNGMSGHIFQALFAVLKNTADLMRLLNKSGKYAIDRCCYTRKTTL